LNSPVATPACNDVIIRIPWFGVKQDAMCVHHLSLYNITLLKSRLEPASNCAISTNDSDRAVWVGAPIYAGDNWLNFIVESDFNRIAIISKMSARLDAGVDDPLTIVGFA
jgi:hypothetical protein